MRSGAAKKRKAAAAKKKKDNNNNKAYNSATTSHENDDPKILEGDVSSPVSEDRQNNQSLGLTEEKRDPSPVRSTVAENISEEVVHNEGDGALKVVEEDDGGVVIADRELNTEQESESKNGSVEHLDFLKKSHSRRSSSSSSSSRSSSSSEDDESKVAEKKSVALVSEKLNGGDSLITEGTDVSDNVPSEEAHSYSITESEPLVDSFEFVEPVLEKGIPLTETYPLETSVVSDVTELSQNEKDVNVSDNAPIEEAHYNSVMETEPIVDSIKLDEPVLGKVIPLTETLANSNLAELGTDEKDEQLLASLDETENIRASATVIDIVSEKNEDNGLTLSYENYGGSSSANAPFTGTRNGEERDIVSEIAECSENQPLIAAAPRPVQKTSWKSCCGLFDVLTSTNDR